MLERLEQAKRLHLLKRRQPLPSFRRYIYDDVAHSPAKLTAIYGSRGVGKTTLLMQLIDQSDVEESEKLYISCDYLYMQGVSLFEFAETFSKYGGKMLCIDEVHEAENFERELKQIYDFLDLKVYFTGSSAIALRSPDFARRYSMYHLAPLSFREYLVLAYQVDLSAISLPSLLKEHERAAIEIIKALGERKILKMFDDFLREGVYPFYFEDPLKYIDRISDTIDKVLYMDIAGIYGIAPDKIENLKKLLATVCVSKPFEFTMDGLAQKTGITKSTLYKYLNYLHHAELLSLVTHEAKRFANVRKSDKLYMANTNLLETICANKEKGTVRETFFVSMLRPFHRLHYTSQGDFLVNETYTFEIGGKRKGYTQIDQVPQSYLVIDGVETGFDRKIPLWLFGFLY